MFGTNVLYYCFNSRYLAAAQCSGKNDNKYYYKTLIVLSMTQVDS